MKKFITIITIICLFFGAMYTPIKADSVTTTAEVYSIVDLISTFLAVNFGVEIFNVTTDGNTALDNDEQAEIVDFVTSSEYLKRHGVEPNNQQDPRNHVLYTTFTDLLEMSQRNRDYNNSNDCITELSEISLDVAMFLASGDPLSSLGWKVPTVFEGCNLSTATYRLWHGTGNNSGTTQTTDTFTFNGVVGCLPSALKSAIIEKMNDYSCLAIGTDDGINYSVAMSNSGFKRQYDWLYNGQYGDGWYMVYKNGVLSTNTSYYLGQANILNCHIGSSNLTLQFSLYSNCVMTNGNLLPPPSILLGQNGYGYKALDLTYLNKVFEEAVYPEPTNTYIDNEGVEHDSWSGYDWLTEEQLRDVLSDIPLGTQQNYNDYGSELDSLQDTLDNINTDTGFLKGIYNKIKQLTPSNIANAFKSILNKIIDLLKNIKNAIVGLPQSFVNLFNSIVAAIQGIPSNIANTYNNIINGIYNLFIPSAQSLTDVKNHFNGFMYNHFGVTGTELNGFFDNAVPFPTDLRLNNMVIFDLTFVNRFVPLMRGFFDSIIYFILLFGIYRNILSIFGKGDSGDDNN